jgi:hypothetical protein
MLQQKHWIVGSLDVAVLALFMLTSGCGSGGSIALSAPVIVQQPASQTAPLGSTASSSVVVTRSAPLNYQWSENGTASRTFASDNVCIRLYVSSRASHNGYGRKRHIFRSLEDASLAVRDYNRHANVCVIIKDGLYALTEPLRFTSLDGGQGTHSVIWQAAPGAKPVISGGIRVTGWRLFDTKNHIYVADTPVGMDSRQVWVDGVLADRASIEIEPRDIRLTSTGFIVENTKLAAILAEIKLPARLEMETTGISEDRYSPVANIEGNQVTMQQPAWDNNTWGYDTPNRPWNPEVSRFFLVNALELMGQRHEWHRNENQWFINPQKGELYFKPAEGVDINTLDIILPRLETLLSIAGTYGNPVKNLTFRGLRFSYTTWNQPSQATGYASQQSGAFLSEVSSVRPKHAFDTCGQGCPEFESMRERWSQMPAAIQVSAANKVAFVNNSFTQLGLTALGIGNDVDANLSGTGLGTDSIRVAGNRFAVLSAGAIMAGGVRRDAHHPSDPRMVNKNLLIANNTIVSVSNEYKDTAAILSTYVDGVSIVHNDISDANYDAIDIGWGWGINDAGGNLNYRLNMKGYSYNPIYSTPTTLRNNVVAFNRIHGVKKWFIDSGAIYNLSRNPGTVIVGNYIFDQGERTDIYLDEGTHEVCVKNNVLATQGYWLTANTLHSLSGLHVTADNIAQDNWHNSDKTGGQWSKDINNLILGDHLIPDSNWPRDARNIIRNAGLEPHYLPQGVRRVSRRSNPVACDSTRQ